MTINKILKTHLPLSLNLRSILRKPENGPFASFSRRTPDSLRAKLLVASTALRAYRNRHLGTLILCCEASEPVRQCIDQNSFECIDFHGLSQIIANLARERLSARRS